jgi:hypothetical protein
MEGWGRESRGWQSAAPGWAGHATALLHRVAAGALWLADQGILRRSGQRQAGQQTTPSRYCRGMSNITPALVQGKGFSSFQAVDGVSTNLGGGERRWSSE